MWSFRCIYVKCNKICALNNLKAKRSAAGVRYFPADSRPKDKRRKHNYPIISVNIKQNCKL